MSKTLKLWCFILFTFTVTIRSTTASAATGECTLNDHGECIADKTDDCSDHDSNCLQWASQGKCSPESGESEATLKACPRSCRVCWSCADEDKRCEGWANKGECKANPRFMLVYCAKSCNICHYEGDLNELMIERKKQHDEEVAEKEALDKTKYGVEQVFYEDADKAFQEEIVEYIEKVVMVDEKYATVRDECKMRHEYCIYWARIGECENTKKFMETKCAPACKCCEKLDVNIRCPYDRDAPTALNPGDLGKLFANLITMKQYSPTILSMPNSTSEDIVDGPWVITFDDFLTPEECERLIEMGASEGYKESADVGKQKFDGTFDLRLSTGRTSSNAWCEHDCFSDSMTVSITERLESILSIPQANFEFFQLLKYEVGQYYNVHHDYIEHHLERAQGVRTLTVFFYLNDVEEGGGTNFDKLGLTVMPKRGRALIWPSVYDADPNKKDDRTSHQALPVEKGRKFGANAWIHQRDFKEPFDRACI